MVAQAPAPLAGGNPNHPPSEEASSSAHIYIFNGIDLTTHTTTYDTPTKPDKEKVTNGIVSDLDPPSTTITRQSMPLQIEKPTFDSILRPPKRNIQKSTFDPSSFAAKKYNIVEDLDQALCAMSTLEVIQHYPRQRRTLLAAIRVIELDLSNNITFNLDNFKS